MAAFDAKSVKIRDKNLIEASAGTGKTFSVAILVLRLILENSPNNGKSVPLEKILMVTFTNAAVDDLELRIREFIRKAYKSLSQGLDCEKEIKLVIENAIKQSNKADCLDKLKRAVQSLDNLSVMTIHSFCQKFISDYPFETRQPFESELITDSRELITYFVNEYWRSEINTIDDQIVFSHLNNYISRDKMVEVISRVLGDKEYICAAIDKKQKLSELKKGIQETNKRYEAFENHTNNAFPDFGKGKMGAHAQNLINKSDNNSQLFINHFTNVYRKNPNTKYLQATFQTECALYQSYLDADLLTTEVTNEFVYYLYSEIIDQLKDRIIERKDNKKTITYDDLISIMHEAVWRNSVNSIVQSHYDVVFIDEFQDTDKKQYEIFARIFGDSNNLALQHKIVFYIGDPKQSIYGWRKADIATYKKAKAEVNVIHEMNHNFRSTADLITALNSFFGISNPFTDTAIQYHDVEKGALSIGEMTESDQEVLPLAINYFPNNDSIPEFVKNQINRLVHSEEIKIKGRSVKPSDIAIITRTNIQADIMKKALSDANIPSIVISGQSVLKSDENEIVLYLLAAVINLGHKTINKLLLNPAFGFNRNAIEQTEVEQHVEIFRNLKKEWNNNGVYNMVFAFLNIYGVWKHCLARGIKGQRILSNFMQIAEILHQHVLKSKCTLDGLYVWLQRERSSKSEEYEQRIESEDDAVKITTIHKAKGLTYNVVFAPYLDLKIKENVDLFEFRDETGYKFTHRLTPEQEGLWRTQNEQENRRLIYVALTRARYKVYICRNTSAVNKDSSLAPFLTTSSPLYEIDVDRALTESPAQKEFEKGTKGAPFAPRTPKIESDELKVPLLTHSFSALNNKHYSAPFERMDLVESYDHFIFQEVGRGATVGTALHSIFERLDFNNEPSWEQTLKNAANYYPNILKEHLMHHFKSLVKQTMEVDISLYGDTFRLNQITPDKMLPELQFNFSISGVSKNAIDEIMGEEAELAGDADIQGLMSGFVDLLFKHNGKYYILDWKSNHLGNSLENYDSTALHEAMKASNYNLQYMIYTVAVKRWLESRISGFDYEKQFGGVIYLFLRGLRQGGHTGIFTARPGYSMIEQMEKAFNGVAIPSA